jgi:hypothetical protein
VDNAAPWKLGHSILCRSGCGSTETSAGGRSNNDKQLEKQMMRCPRHVLWASGIVLHPAAIVLKQQTGRENWRKAQIQNRGHSCLSSSRHDAATRQVLERVTKRSQHV